MNCIFEMVTSKKRFNILHAHCSLKEVCTRRDTTKYGCQIHRTQAGQAGVTVASGQMGDKSENVLC